MSLTTDVTFRRTDTSFTQSNTTLACRVFDTQASVDTTGWTLTHIQNGIYELVVPAATVKSIYSIVDNATGLITADGTLDPAAAGGGLDEAGVRAAIGMASANLDTQLAALPTAAENADAVWDELLADHMTLLSAARYLAASGAAGDPWIADLPGTYTGTQAGRIIGALLARELTLLNGIDTGVIVRRVTTGGRLTLVRGDVETITFRLGTGFPLTGRTARLTVKKFSDKSLVLDGAACSTTDAVNGACTYTTSVDTFADAGRFVFDVEVSDTADGANPQTALIGTLIVLQDVND